ncbi:hypothetical protein GF312_18795, partial [Candidatus Poribacteria bacterium]|nr:hypothetical protein [Candidatus Poribacteria bacterium]
MDQDKQQLSEENSKKPRLSVGLWLGIIAVLLAVIIAGLAYIWGTPRGKIPVTIEDFDPEGEITRTTNFTVEFSQDMVPENQVDIQIDNLPIEFSPEIPGKFRWIARNKLRFFPEITLKPSTEYTAKILPEICTVEGMYLKGDRRFSFYTQRFRVDNTYFSFNLADPDGDKIRILGTIEFNYAVKADDLAENLSLSFENGPKIPYKVITPDSGLAIKIETESLERNESDKNLQLNISQNLKPIDGNLGLSQDYVQTIVMKAKEELKVEGVFAEQRGQKSYIKIRFSSPVSVDMAKQFITLEPKMEHTISTSSYNYVEISGNFQAGKGYTVNVNKGIIGVDGSRLKSDFSSRVVMQNLEPSIGFVGDGIYLSRQGNLNIGLSTININEVEIEIQKVYANNLIHLLHTNTVERDYGWYNLNNLGKVVNEKEINIASRLNEEIVTPISMRDYLMSESKGIFALIARNVEKRWQYSRKWVMITDLGITVKNAGGDFLIWVNSLSSLEPVSNAEITLLSRNNQIMGTKSTDQDGTAVFNLSESVMEEFEPYLVTVSHEGDLSFLDMDHRRVDTTDYNVEGRPYLQYGYDVFIYGDRDIYRPGETAHVVAVIRGTKTSVPPSFPLKMEILGPDNRIFTELMQKTGDAGACEFDVEFPSYVKTGRYTARAIVGKDNEIGRGYFSVEEFMPDRIKVKVTTDSDSYELGQDVKVNVEAVNLFGPPASGRQLEARAEIISHDFSVPQWKSFTFRDSSKSFDKKRMDLGKATLDQNGKYTYNMNIKDNIQPPSSLQANISATVLEPGGRGVTGYKTVDVHPYSHYVGIRRTKEGYADVGKPAEMDFIAVDKNGKVAPGRQYEVSCYRITWHSILRRAGRRGYRYVSEKQENLVKSFPLQSGERPTKFSFTPDDYGEYRVAIKDIESSASASINFYASGWGYAPWAMNKPERLEIDLDKESYNAGDTAQVQIRSPFAGKLLLTVEGDRIHHRQSVIMDENTAKVSVPLSSNYKPNAYIVASVIRSTRSLERHAPVRAFGVVPLSMNNEEKRLSITMNTPAEMRPKTSLDVSFTVKGTQTNKAYITIAAVDEGICQLTGFETPDPFSFFYGKKRLEVNSYDIYSAVLPEIENAMSASTTAGDQDTSRRRVTPVNIQRVKPVALWSGIMETDRNGKGSVSFDIPQFNGSLRIMAVAFSDDSFGSTRNDVKVFDPIVLTPTFPRFMAGGDSIQIPVSIFNGTGVTGNFSVTLGFSGPIETLKPESHVLQLEPKAEKQVFFLARAENSMGKITFNLSASGGGEKSEMSVDLPLRPAAPAITITGSGVVKPNQDTTLEIPGAWIPDTAEFELTLSSFPATQFSSSLQYLLRYPYGCAEQTTSKLFPLLYFNDMAKLVEPELFGTKSPDYYIIEGIQKLGNMQNPSGDFSFWPRGNYSNPWTSIYVSHFLVEARKAGYEVPDRVYDNMINALKAHAKSSIRDYWMQQAKVYACYVLALAGRPEKSVMLYLKNNELDDMWDYSQFQLAGAFALSGDARTARSLIPNTAQPREIERETGRNFNSSTRARAIMLDVLSEVDPDHPSVPKLVRSLSDDAAKNNRWYTTQDNAFAFLALGKIMRKHEKADYKGEAVINGSQLADFDEGDYKFSGKDWGGKTIDISIDGQGTCYYYWKAFGVPTTPDIKEYDQELVVRRRYLDKNGREIRYDNFQQGDVVVAEIKAKAVTEDLNNVVIADLLPAGLEIENPRLGSRAGIPWIQDKGVNPSYMDIRDDRMLLFVDLPRQKEQKFYYGLRAVTVGNFVLPPVAGEAMYDPTKISIANSGRIKV